MTSTLPTVPLPQPAPRSPFIHLVADPCIALSWFIALGAGTLFALSQTQARVPVKTGDAVSQALGASYACWALYFGLAGSWRLFRRAISAIARRLSLAGWTTVASAMFSAGCLVTLFAGWLIFAFAFMYALCGGGIYQFGRRWWLLAHGQHPPFLRA